MEQLLSRITCHRQPSILIYKTPLAQWIHVAFNLDFHTHSLATIVIIQMTVMHVHACIIFLIMPRIKLMSLSNTSMKACFCNMWENFQYIFHSHMWAEKVLKERIHAAPTILTLPKSLVLPITYFFSSSHSLIPPYFSSHLLLTSS